ncbi:NAD(P)/FAD-dependent oxidoreductase [Saccharothrix longispora]|uniref:NAD(P)/FAD-dependent oxidoreductase n=1 Tax=Saccharothrix longispora TaxID=33920 RepID=UPI00286ACD68|nr:FAD-dependent oxidoreductase [Saccharothrix longispora]
MIIVGVVVVGAGIAGVACARALADSGVAVRVLERAPVVGGRMATKRYGGRRADIGAGYFTVSDDRFAAVVTRWQGAGLAREWTDTLAVHSAGGVSHTTGPVRWAASGGLRSLVVDLASGLDVVTGHAVEWVEPGPRVDGAPADAVVLAMPGPQALRLLDPRLGGARTAAQAQDWLPSLVATLEYPTRDWVPFHGAFVNDHPVLTTLFDDGSRRGDDAPVLVAHTGDAFAGQYVADADAAAEDVEAAVRDLLHLPEAAVRVHVHRWTFARPATPGTAPFHLDGDLVGIAGDAWGSPKVENAWLSGTLLGEALATRLR